MRKLSKAVATGNHVTFTDREVVPVTFHLDGLVTDKAELGYYKVAGRDMVLAGYTVDVRLPANARNLVMTAQLATGQGDLIDGTVMPLHGVKTRGELPLSPGLTWPTDSTWKVVIRADGVEDVDMPQGLVLTYLLRYANGAPVLQNNATSFRQDGVGFETIGERINPDGGPGSILPPNLLPYGVPEGRVLFGAGTTAPITYSANFSWDELTATLTVGNYTATGTVTANALVVADTAQMDSATVTGLLAAKNIAAGWLDVAGVASNLEIDFALEGYQTINLTGDLTSFSVLNTGNGRCVVMRILAGAADRAVTGWPAEWDFGSATPPALITAGTSLILSVTCFGSVFVASFRP